MLNASQPSGTDFKVVVLGTGDTFSASRHPTSLLLEAEGFRLGIDCPDMYRRVLRDASSSSGAEYAMSDVDHVLITHVHGDHMNGLEGMAFYKHFVEQKRVNLIASREVRQVLWEQRLQVSMGTLWDGSKFRALSFEDYFRYIPLEWDAPLQLGPFQIRARMTRHHVPTSALFVECKGRAFSYSSDTAFDPELIAFLEPANLICHETNYGPAHTPYSALSSLPQPIRDKLRLIHYSDSFDVNASCIPVAQQGQVWCP